MVQFIIAHLLSWLHGNKCSYERPSMQGKSGPFCWFTIFCDIAMWIRGCLKAEVPGQQSNFRSLTLWVQFWGDLRCMGGMAMKSERNQHVTRNWWRPASCNPVVLNGDCVSLALWRLRTESWSRGVETEAGEPGNTARKMCQKCMMTKVVSSKGNICNRKWTLLCALYTHFMLQYLHLKEGSARK